MLEGEPKVFERRPWSDVWPEFEEQMRAVASNHYEGKDEINFEDLSDEEKEEIVEIWMKVLAKTIDHADAICFTNYMRDKIVEKHPTDPRGNVRSAVLSFLNNKAAVVIGRRDVDKMSKNKDLE